MNGKFFFTIAALIVLLAVSITYGETEVNEAQSGAWTRADSPYVVTGDVNVLEGETLTIEPGVEVKFDGNYGIDVFGTLIADGTSSEEIVFTSNQSTKNRGDWKAIYFEPTGGNSIMDYCIVEYGGSSDGWGWANICVDGISTVNISNTVSRRSYDVSINVKNEANPTITDCEFAYNRYDGMAVQINSYPVLGGNSAHHNDRWNGIMVYGGHITASGTWYADSIPYIINDSGANNGNRDIAAEVTLTIEAGTVIKFENNGTVSFNVYGTLDAKGTDANPIIFTSAADDDYLGDTNGDGSSDGLPEDWEQISFESDSTNNIIQHCVFKYAGQDGCTIDIHTDSVQIENCLFAHGGGDGIQVRDQSNPVITGCEFAENADDAIELEINSYPVLRDNSAHDNEWNGINVHGGHIEVSGTWYADGIPYVINDSGANNGNRDIAAGVTLTIEAGTVIKFENNGTVSFNVYGTLDAKGTDANPIIFTSLADDDYLGDTNGDGNSSGLPEDWEDLFFEPESVDNVLQHCVFKYGGEDDYTIGIYTNSINFEDCAVSDGGSDGIRIEDASPTISRIQISNIPGDGIYCVNASPTIDSCTFSDNGNSPLHLKENSFPTYTGNNTSTISTTDGSIKNGILVNGNMTVDGILHKGFVPYIIDQHGDSGGPRDGVTLTIDQGTILKFPQGNYDLNIYDSALVAVGTKDEPIVFTSILDDEYGGDTNGDGDSTGEPNDWSAIEDCGAGGRLDYCIVRFAGNRPDYALELSETASLPITNCIFEENGGKGAILVGKDYDNTISDCKIVNNLNHGIHCEGGTVTIKDCTIQSNGENADGDGIWIHNKSNATVENCTISNNQEDGIDAGSDSSVVVKNCVIANNGVEGTNEGYGIGFYSGSTGTIENCEISGSYRDGIYLDHSENAVVRNNTILDNKGDGIYAKSASATITGCDISQNDDDGVDCNDSTLEISDCIIKGNGIEETETAGLYVRSGGEATIHNSTIANNRHYGVWNETQTDVDATYNWWGDISGPYHETKNPDGKGNKVSDYVNFEPYMESSPTVPDDTTTFRGNSYKVITQGMSWHDAKSHAESLGGHLVTISDEEENTFVADLAGEKGVSREFWIGLTDEVEEGNFVWVTGEPLDFTFWDTEEPNDYGGDEDYAVIGWNSEYGWNDINDSRRPFVVEFERTAPTPTLIGYWNLNEGSGNIAHDSSGNGNDGTISEAAWVDNGGCGQALSFDGRDDYVEISYTELNHPEDQITVSLWFKTDEFNDHDLVSTHHYGGYGIEFDEALTWNVNIEGAGYTSIHIPQEYISLNTWYFVTGTYDGNALSIYLNGVLKDELVITGKIHYAHDNSVIVGADASSGTGTESQYGYFKGYIDEVRIYNYALTQSEIQTDMRKCTPITSPAEITLSVQASSNSLPADGSTTAIITATVKDTSGNPLSEQDVQMTVSKGQGTLNDVNDNGDGTYTATYTASSQAGTETITVTVADVSKTVDIILTSGVVERTLSITSVEVSPGAHTTVQVAITDATGVSAGDILVKYDADLITIGQIKGTDLISGITLIINKDVLGEITISMAGAKGIPSGSGTLIEIGMTVSEDAEEGTETMLELVATDTELYDESGEIIPINLENGVVKVAQAGIKGDVNNDGRIRANDALLALRIAAGLMDPTDYQKWAADMNGDGRIRANDALLILRKAAGLAAPDMKPIASVSGTITIMLNETHGVAGESITVPLNVDNINDLSGGDIRLCYDSTVLRAVEVTTKHDLALVGNIAESGMIRIAFAGTDRLDSKTIAEIRFDILADDVSPLMLQRVELYRPDGLLVDSISMDGQFSSWAVTPERSALLQNFPNPLNPETWIPYQLKKGSEVTIRIYSVAGELVRTLELGNKVAGLYVSRDRTVRWDGRNKFGALVASGVYFYNIQAGDFTAVRKLIVLK